MIERMQLGNKLLRVFLNHLFKNCIAINFSAIILLSSGMTGFASASMSLISHGIFPTTCNNKYNNYGGVLVPL